MRSYFILAILLAILGSVIAEDAAKVKVKQGWVAGSRHRWETGKEVYRFINVPYAQPPIGERRFKDPEPITSWKGTWDATKDINDLVTCLSYRHVPRGLSLVQGQEDCLYLTIYTPWLPSPENNTKLLDVIVYIHGGGFMFGAMKYNHPISLMTKHNVVFVKFNYRVGPLGFLSTGDDVVPGNMGLKDQTQALRWIKENIAQFGGNPDSVTISGCSAGGASVHFHMLSPQSKGLFHKAISMSGTLLSPWPIAENLPEKSRILARHVGCPESPSKDLVECLQNRPATYLANVVKSMQPFFYNPFTVWGLTIDSFARESVLPDYPVKLIMQGKVYDVPWINALCTDEGLYPGAEFLPLDNVLNDINKNWTSLAPYLLDFNNTVRPSARKEVAARIRYKYFKDEPISSTNYKPLIQMFGDRLFSVDSERASRFMSGVMKSPVYFYIFNFRGRVSMSNAFSMNQNNYGVSHSDDVNYVAQFRLAIMTNTTEEELATMDFMGDLWASFAAKGKPHISNWTPVQPNAFSYLQINSGTNQTMFENVTEIASRSFWDSLPIDEHNIWPDPDKKTGVLPTEEDKDNKV